MFNFFIESITNGFSGIMDLTLKGISFFFSFSLEKELKLEDEEGFRSIFFDPNLRSYIGLYSSVSDFKTRFLEKPEELDNLKKILDSLESFSETEEANILRQFLNFFEGISLKEKIDWSFLKESLKDLKGKFFFNFLSNFEPKEEFLRGELKKELPLIIESKKELSEAELPEIESNEVLLYHFDHLKNYIKEESESLFKLVNKMDRSKLIHFIEAYPDLYVIFKSKPGSDFISLMGGDYDLEKILLQIREFRSSISFPYNYAELPQKNFIGDGEGKKYLESIKDFIEGESINFFKVIVGEDIKGTYTKKYPLLYSFINGEPLKIEDNLDGFLTELKESRLDIATKLNFVQMEYINLHQLHEKNEINHKIYQSLMTRGIFGTPMSMFHNTICNLSLAKTVLLSRTENGQFDMVDYDAIRQKAFFEREEPLEELMGAIEAKIDSDAKLASLTGEEQIKILNGYGEKENLVKTFILERERVKCNLVHPSELEDVMKIKRGELPSMLSDQVRGERDFFEKRVELVKYLTSN